MNAAKELAGAFGLLGVAGFLAYLAHVGLLGGV
jgi:hypothetical protein